MSLNKKVVSFFIIVLFALVCFSANFNTVQATKVQDFLSIFCDYLNEGFGSESGFCWGSGNWPFNYSVDSGSFQIYYIGDLSNYAVGKYIDIIGEGGGHAEWCLNSNNIWMSGPCWGTGNIDVIDDGPPVPVLIDFFGYSSDYENNNHFMLLLYADDAIWNASGNSIVVNGKVSNRPRLLINSRKVHANFTTVPTEVAVNDTFNVYWDWEWATINKNFWATGALDCQWDGYNPEASCTALPGFCTPRRSLALVYS